MLRASKFVDLATIALFLAGLCLPLVDEFSRSADQRATTTEFRQPARQPRLPVRKLPFSKEGFSYLTSEEGLDWLLSRSALSWMTRYPKRYEAFHTDSFGYRETLLSQHCELTWRLFGESPSPIAIRGKGDWVFSDDAHEQATWRGAKPVSEPELVAWSRAIRGRREFYAEHGIKYLFCIAPDKSSVYPEYTPEWAVAGESRLKQLESLLKDEESFLSLTNAVLAEKVRDDGEDLTYRRLGTHWTERGAKAASDAIAERLRGWWPELVDVPRSRFDYEEIALHLPDDMGARLHVRDEILGERSEYGLRVRLPRMWRVKRREGRDVYSTGTVQDAPTAWFHHDSFGSQLRPYLLQHLGDSACFWRTRSDMDELLAAEPDVVIELCVERALNYLPPTIPRMPGHAVARERFSNSDRTLFAIPSDDPWPAISPNEKANLEVVDAGLRIERTRIGAGVWLPPVNSPAARELVLRLDVSAAVEDDVYVIYSVEGQGGFDARRSLAARVKPGRNEIYFELMAPKLTGRIYLHPLSQGESLVLHAVEMRAVAY